MLDYGIIGNCKTCALVKKNASIEWMCYPDFNSPSVFAKILDQEIGGSFSLRPVGNYTIKQRYIPGTAILETMFTNLRHAFVVYDFFPRYKKLTKKKHERLFTQNNLFRIIKPLRGSPKIRIDYDPKPHYARINPTFEVVDSNLICDGLSLTSNISFKTIMQSEPFVLDRTKYLIMGGKKVASDCSVKYCLSLLRATKTYWEKWVDTLILPEQNKEIIIRSAITLKLLTYSPTGAIIAAPTTSIPEEVGTDRTWDYRYCWVRDSVFCVDALKKIGRDYEAKKLMDFILRTEEKSKGIQIMYGINGEKKLTEKKLMHLEGYHGSKPVRVGNAAHSQLQHDIYGEIIDLFYLYFGYYQYETRMRNAHWKFICRLVNLIKQEWRKKDSGIWEFRGKHEHYTFSKFMCYVGVDRAIKLAQCYGREKHIPNWLRLRDEIQESVLLHGFNPEVNAFTMHYGSKELDAAMLQMSYYDFIEHTDPRIISTIKKVYHKLRKNYMVQRYTAPDDFGMSKSAFIICSFWLVDALYSIGEVRKARKIYTKLLKKSNHLGLFSEDFDLKTKKLTGNFPQAYTHTALINSSILLSEWSAKRKRINWNLISRKKSWI